MAFEFLFEKIGITFSFIDRITVELHRFFKLFITLFITSKVIFKRNSKDRFIYLS